MLSDDLARGTVLDFGKWQSMKQKQINHLPDLKQKNSTII